jgi:hypothetical protein
MPKEATWEGMDPNSANQLWSRWTFRVHGKRIPLPEVKRNVARWLRRGFGKQDFGRAKVDEVAHDGFVSYRIVAEVEGVEARDPGYVDSVRRDFNMFIQKGWGITAYGTMEVKLLAGDPGDGRPSDQLMVLPSIPLEVPND